MCRAHVKLKIHDKGPGNLEEHVKLLFEWAEVKMVPCEQYKQPLQEVQVPFTVNQYSLTEDPTHLDAESSLLQMVAFQTSSDDGEEQEWGISPHCKGVGFWSDDDEWKICRVYTFVFINEDVGHRHGQYSVVDHVELATASC